MSTKIKPANAQHLTLGIPHNFKVDAASGRILDLALLTGMREAKGHGIYIDAKTLSTAHESVQSKGGRLKAYRTHQHSGPATWSRTEGTELDIPGFFSTIAVRGNELVAGAFEFYDSFKKNFTPQYEQLIEMAAKTPELIGLSIEAWGYAVYVDKDGNEYGQRPDNTELLYDGLPALRVTEIFAAAFVSDPAATDGLFAAFGRAIGFGKLPVGLKAKLKAALDSWSEEEGDELQTEPAALHTPANNKGTPPSTENFSAMKIIETIKAKFGADKAKFSQAMTLLGEQPDITIEALEAKMVQVDLSTAQSEVTRLTTALATANTSVTALTAERDQWKTKFEQLKNSGAPGVDLGAVTAATGQVNPWAKETLNYTKQAEISNTNAALAAQLKAAAGVV
jgi:hypothetical protein